jgi:hypothetical protein
MPALVGYGWHAAKIKTPYRLMYGAAVYSVNLFLLSDQRRLSTFNTVVGLDSIA